MKERSSAHPWPEKIIRGELTGLRSIAQLTSLDEHYAGRILNCSFLAPDIVEAILDGRQPADLSVQKLLRSLPLIWAEQRQRLGFPPGKTD
jgi:site-specific DNA recombinase